MCCAFIPPPPRPPPFLCIVSVPEHAVTTNYIDLASYLTHHTAIFKDVGVYVPTLSDGGRGQVRGESETIGNL